MGLIKLSRTPDRFLLYLPFVALFDNLPIQTFAVGFAENLILMSFPNVKRLFKTAARYFLLAIVIICKFVVVFVAARLKFALKYHAFQMIRLVFNVHIQTFEFTKLLIDLAYLLHQTSNISVLQVFAAKSVVKVLLLRP